MTDSNTPEVIMTHQATGVSLHPQVVPLNHETCSADIIDWSHDNHIAVATKKGVYCLALQSSAALVGSDFKIKKTFLQFPEKSRNKPASEVDLSQGYRQGEVLALENGFRMVRWSPLGCGADGRCLLTTLSLDHSLVLHSLTHKQLQWQRLLDFSLLDSSCEDSSKETSGSTGERNSTEFAMSATNMQWSDTFYKTAVCSVPDNTSSTSELGQERHVMLAVAMKSGHVTVWEFKCPIVDNTSAVSTRKIETTSECITSLAWVQDRNNPPGGIAVGHLDGTISVCPMTVNARSTAILTTCTVLWKEQDLLAITFMKSRPLEKNDRSLLVASKGPHVMCFEVQKSGDTFTLLHTVWTDAVHSMPISGLALSADRRVYTCGMDSTMTVTVITRNESGLSVEPLPINTHNALLKRGYGVVISRNSVYLGCASGLTNALNQVVKLQVNFLKIKSQEDITEHLLSPETGRLACNKDSIEYVRQRFSSNLSLAPRLQTAMYEERNTHPHLQFFLLKLSITMEKGKGELASAETVKNLEERLARVTTFLAVRHMQNILSREKTSLSLSQHTRILLAWLKKEGHGITDIQEMTSVAEQPGEVCRLCQGPVRFEDVRMATCENGHSWERCCLSFAACQVVPYRKCELCGAAALTKTARGSGDVCPQLLMSNTCTFCSGNLL